VSTPIKRKLAAILSADVAGCSRLMGDDEEGALRLLAAHRAVVDSIINFHDGRVVNTAGDSVLAEFTSPVEAVRAATETEEALKTRNESLPEGGRMLFRIGVNLGDVMIQGDDLLGDGVNVAARLQARAEPGGICISGSIYDQLGPPARSETTTPLSSADPRSVPEAEPSTTPSRDGSPATASPRRPSLPRGPARFSSRSSRPPRAPEDSPDLRRHRQRGLLDGAVVGGAVSLLVDVYREEDEGR
jgi:class 3 adenylate cyclase